MRPHAPARAHAHAGPRTATAKRGERLAWRVPIDLPKQARDRMIASIRRFASAELDQDWGDLKAALVLDFALREIAPSVYNLAVADAQKHLLARVEEMSGPVFEPEFQYWTR